MDAAFEPARPLAGQIEHGTLRRARTAVAAIFLLNGALLASWVPHIPAVKARLGLGEAALGGLLLMMALGAVLAFPLASFLIGRFGSRALTGATAVALALLLPLPVLSPSPLLLGLALLAFGAANGALDVSMNAQAVAIEARYGRPILSSLHALFSLGGMLGAGVAAGYFASGASAAVHSVATAVVVAAIVGACTPYLVETPTPALGARTAMPSLSWTLPPRQILGIGMLAFLGLLAEGSIADWSALWLHQTMGASAAIAAAAFAVFSVAMAAGRFAGDSLVERFGEVPLLRASAWMGAAGLTAALVAGNVVVAIAGCAVLGLGIANVIPILFRAGARSAGAHPERGIAAVTSLGYLGLLCGPALIGLVAGATSLPIALGLVACACAAVGMLGGAAVSERPPDGIHRPVSFH